MSKRLILFAFGVLAVLLSCGTVEKAADLASKAAAVQHRDGSSGAETDLSPGSSRTMHEGDGVKIDNAGKGELTFAGCTVEIYWGGNMTLKTSSAPGCALTLETGSIQVNVAEGSQATVNTPWATITSFGTRFFVYVGMEPPVVWVISYEGRLEVRNVQGAVTFDAGFQTWVLPGQMPVDPLPATREMVPDLTMFPPLEILTSYGPPDQRRFDLTDDVWLAEAAVGGTIVLWHSWGEAEILALNDIIEAFRAQNPDVRFDVALMPAASIREQVQVAAQGGGGPTLLMGPADWGPGLYQANLVADMSALASPDLLDRISPVALEAARYHGTLIGVPYSLRGVVMFRNRSIIPQAPGTFDELLSLAKEATQGDVVGMYLERGFFYSAAHLYGIGGQLMDANGNPTFYNDKGVEWVNLLRYFSYVGPAEYYGNQDLERFQAGLAGIIIDGTWNLDALRNSIGAENLSIDPWPAYGDGHLSGYVQSDVVYLNAAISGDDQKAALRFIEFLLSPENQARLAMVGHIPVLAGVEVEDPLIRQALEAFQGGTPYTTLPEMQAYWEPMDAALRSVFDLRADPYLALETAYGSIATAVDAMHGPQ
jgi:arabinogalactan oligomer/maltooligosaccharide transport system substrate-binding protein